MPEGSLGVKQVTCSREGMALCHASGLGRLPDCHGCCVTVCFMPNHASVSSLQYPARDIAWNTAPGN